MISAQFFTTINLKIFLRTLFLLTFYMPFLRFGKDIEKFEEELKYYLCTKNKRVYSFYNGRSALFHFCKQLNLNKDSEILISGYTCVSVVNAVIQAGLKPVYIDIDKETLNMSINDLESKITKKTKVLVVQHTFGNPANMFKILEIAKKNNLIVIEDCAHALGAEINGKKVGTFGDASIFSTGRDKVISSVTGGFLLINNENINFKMPKLYPVSKKLAISNLIYNIIAYISWKTYDIKIGKILMYLSRKFNIIPEILTKSEKACNFNNFYYQLPNSLAYLARKELKNIDKINYHRINVANFYINNIEIPTIKTLKNGKNIYFGYPIFIDNIDKILSKFKKYNIYFGVYWSNQNIVPNGTNLEKCIYEKGTCPNAEDISKKIIIFPNHFQINLKQAKKICNILNSK